MITEYLGKTKAVQSLLTNYTSLAANCSCKVISLALSFLVKRK